MHAPLAPSLWPWKGRSFLVTPSDPYIDGRAPHQFHMDCRDLGDAQLQQLMEDLWQEVAHRSWMFPPVAHPWATGGPLQEVGTPNVEDEEVTFPGGVDGDPTRHYHSQLSPSYRGECWLSPQYPCHWIKVRYSKDQYIQWQCHTRRNRGILWAVVPWGTMHQGSPPGIGGLRKGQWQILPSTWVLLLV